MERCLTGEEMLRRQRSRRFDPRVDGLEGRELLSTLPNVTPFDLATNPAGNKPIRPNTPVLPFGYPSKRATFIDTTVKIKNGNHQIIGYQDYIAPM